MKLVHCSYHKCLTVYVIKVLAHLNNGKLRFSQGYWHYDSYIDQFYRESDQFKISSVNNHALDLEKLGDDFRITRFIRDPRDLVVSGYFYHRRGAEPWCNIVDPSPGDWVRVNGCIPANMGPGHSYSSYLHELSTEDGLLAEIEYRRNHFDSMLQWPMSDPRIKIFHYEDIIGNELHIFGEMFSHYGFSRPRKALGLLLADRYSAKRRGSKTKHIRNPKAGQWKEHFTPKVTDFFEQQYGEILDRYGYA